MEVKEIKCRIHKQLAVHNYGLPYCPVSYQFLCEDCGHPTPSIRLQQCVPCRKRKFEQVIRDVMDGQDVVVIEEAVRYGLKTMGYDLYDS